MKQLSLILLLLLQAGCATLGRGPSAKTPPQLWAQAHGALHLGEYAAADSLFTLLSEVHTHTTEGQDASFYLGVTRLDPKNPSRNVARGVQALDRYLTLGLSQESLRHAASARALLAANVSPTRRPVAPTASTPSSARLQATVDSLAVLATEKDRKIEEQAKEIERLRKLIVGTGR